MTRAQNNYIKALLHEPESEAEEIVKRLFMGAADKPKKQRIEYTEPKEPRKYKPEVF